MQGLLAMPGVALPMPVCASSVQGVAEGIPCAGVGHYEAEGRPLNDHLPERCAHQILYWVACTCLSACLVGCTDLWVITALLQPS